MPFSKEIVIKCLEVCFQVFFILFIPLITLFVCLFRLSAFKMARLLTPTRLRVRIMLSPLTMILEKCASELK